MKTPNESPQLFCGLYAFSLPYAFFDKVVDSVKALDTALAGY